MKKTLVVAALLLTSCNTASVPLADSQSDAQGKSFAAPPPGQATIYILRVGDIGTLVNVNVGPRPLGPLGNYTWFRVDVPPGTVDVRCTGGENSKSALIPIAASETRFVETKAMTGWAAPRCDIFEVPADQGKAGVLRGNRAAALN